MISWVYLRKEEVEMLDKMLAEISKELMSEVEIPDSGLEE